MRNKNGQLVRFGVQLLAFNNTDFLEASIKILQPFVDCIMVSTSEKSWFGNIPNDGTVEAVVKPLALEFENVYLTGGNFKTEAEQRNDCLEKMREFDFVFIIDSDEMWSTGDLHKVMSFVTANSGFDIFTINWNTRFKKIDWVVEPRENYKPIVVVKKGIRFFKNRLVAPTAEISTALIPEDTAVVEHFSYVREKDLDIKEKIQTFSHANEIVNGIEWWFENVYLQADLESTMLHPTNPEAYASLRLESLNLEILQFLKKYSPKLFKK